MLKLNTSLSPYKTIAAASLAGLFLCLSAQTALAEAPADADFKKLDVNSDAKISLKEAVKDKTLATSFDMTDANKDGNISVEEYAGYKAAMMTKSPDGAAPAAAPVN
jgi:hypothetical protein